MRLIVEAGCCLFLVWVLWALWCDTFPPAIHVAESCPWCGCTRRTTARDRCIQCGLSRAHAFKMLAAVGPARHGGDA